MSDDEKSTMTEVGRRDGTTRRHRPRARDQHRRPRPRVRDRHRRRAQGHGIDMTLTSAACPLTDVIEDQVAEALDGIAAGVSINWVWMPPWGPDRITPEGREQLRALGFNV